MDTRDLPGRVAAFAAAHDLLPRGARVVVAVSGGVDSLVLLHVLVQVREALDLMLHAATLDHGLRGAAGTQDAAYVRDVAAGWGVPVTLERADVPHDAQTHNLGLEEAARRARYAFLARVAHSVGADRVVTGHHRDDQAETVLLNVIRGSGLDGLRGMLPAAPLPDSGPDSGLLVVRPLLNISRAAIEAYAAAHDLAPRTDATNTDPAYRRNRLRHVIMPQLEALNPNLRAALARMAGVLRVDADWLEMVGAAELARVVVSGGAFSTPGVIALDRAAWADLHPGAKRYVVRAAVEQASGARHDLALVHVEAAIQAADRGAVGALVQFPGGVTLRVERDVLLVTRGDALPALDVPALEAGQGVTFRAGDRVERDFGAWRFAAHPLRADDDLAAWHADPLAAALAVPAGTALHLRPPQPGDRFQPRGLGGRSQKLVTTFSSMGVPVIARARVPLLEAGDAPGRIAWFVAPSDRGLRGRVAQPFAVPDGLPPARALIGVSWRRKGETIQDL